MKASYKLIVHAVYFSSMRYSPRPVRSLLLHFLPRGRTAFRKQIYSHGLLGLERTWSANCFKQFIQASRPVTIKTFSCGRPSVPTSNGLQSLLGSLYQAWLFYMFFRGSSLMTASPWDWFDRYKWDRACLFCEDVSIPGPVTFFSYSFICWAKVESVFYEQTARAEIDRYKRLDTIVTSVAGVSNLSLSSPGVHEVNERRRLKAGTLFSKKIVAWSIGQAVPALSTLLSFKRIDSEDKACSAVSTPARRLILFRISGVNQQELPSSQSSRSSWTGVICLLLRLAADGWRKKKFTQKIQPSLSQRIKRHITPLSQVTNWRILRLHWKNWQEKRAAYSFANYEPGIGWP